MNNAGVGSGDYLEQVTYLLFLKLDAEREEDGLPSLLPAACRWARLAALTGRDLAQHDARTLEQLALQPGLVGTIYTRAKSTIEEPGLGRADTTPIHRADALLADPGQRWDVILTNPPFGRRQSIQAFTGDGEAETEREDYQRPGFAVTTGNKQLNFVQHIMTALARNGTAAVVLPDSLPPPAENGRQPTGGCQSARKRGSDSISVQECQRRLKSDPLCACVPVET